MQRRSFLKVGLLGGAILALTGGGLAMWPGDSSARPLRPLLSISAGSFPVLVAVAARVCKGTTAQPIQVAHAVDTALSFTFPEARRDMDRVLGLLENALPGLLLRGSPRPFTLLNEDAQDRALHAWRDSSVGLLRGAYHALRKLCLAAHYATPGSWPEVDYGGPLIPKPDPPPITLNGSLVVDAGSKAEGMPQ
ncbi:MAG: hypothetical protein Q8O67_28670 [Deltaproteobacteria bacterium]|nr:hypothetical protein [Deltaproteobacteria bacterium]